MQARGTLDELEKKRRHIRSLMRYAVPDEATEDADDLLLLFRDDRPALTVLEEFYSFLPEAKNDWIKELRLVARQRGVFLIAAVASEDAYLYLVSSEGIEFNGSLREGWLDQDLLDFFEFESAEAFQQAAQDVEQIPEYQPVQVDANLCPACQAETGELHELGCPVEICPWCGGQLIHCDCRFEQLGVDEMSESDLLRFEALLEEQGRVAYAPEQRPSFADEGPGIEVD